MSRKKPRVLPLKFLVSKTKHLALGVLTAFLEGSLPCVGGFEMTVGA